MGRKRKPDKGAPSTIYLRPEQDAQLEAVREALKCTRSEAIERLIRYGWRALVKRAEPK